MSEKLNNGGENFNGSSANNEPWGEEYKHSVPPFSGNKEQPADSSETGNSKAEPYEYYDFEGVEYIRLTKIDISTDQGKSEWLHAFLENQSAKYEKALKDAKDVEDDDDVKNAKDELDFIKQQQKFLDEKIHIDDDGGIMGALQREYLATSKRCAEMAQSGKATPEAMRNANTNHIIAESLLGQMEEEIARRDPNYFGQSEIRLALENGIERAEREIASTMVDGYVGEDGFIHMNSNGEKIPTPATKEAEMDLEYAKQDAATFDLLMEDYQSTIDHGTPHAIRKKDFIPIINSFIDSHNAQIEQLKIERKNLAKGTPEYAENDAKRKKLVSERNSAKRLAARFF